MSNLAGYHSDPEGHRFVVFRIDRHWYWRAVKVDSIMGPYSNDVEAYQAAMGSKT